jgi:hypothetical protein
MNEQENFCGTICLAASRLNIYGRFQQDYFVWFDPMNGARWKTPTGTDKKDILFKACESLSHYLAP